MAACYGSGIVWRRRACSSNYGRLRAPGSTAPRDSRSSLARCRSPTRKWSDPQLCRTQTARIRAATPCRSARAPPRCRGAAPAWPMHHIVRGGAVPGVLHHASQTPPVLCRSGLEGCVIQRARAGRRSTTHQLKPNSSTLSAVFASSEQCAGLCVDEKPGRAHRE